MIVTAIKYRYYLALISILNCCTIVQAQWIGGPKNERAVAFAQTDEHLFLLANTRSYGAGSEDIWQLKYNKELLAEHQQLWGFEHYDLGTDILTTSDGHYLFCGYSWDAPGGRTSIVVAKYDLDGHQQWIAYFGGYHNDLSYSIKEAKDGGYLICGIDRGYGNLGAIFLVKLNREGVLQWEQYYDTANKDIGMDIAICQDSSYMIVANTNSFIGQIANSSEYLTADASGMMIIKTNKYGIEQWRKFYGGPAHDFASKIVSNGQDEFYIVGSSMNNSNGSFDMTLHKIDLNGTMIWRKNYGGSGYEYGNNIDINAAGELLLCGTSSSYTTDQNPDILLLKVDSEGNELWQQTYGGNYSDYGKDAQFGPNESVFLMGTSQYSAQPDLDVYMIQTDPLGNLIRQISTKADYSVNPYNVFPNPAQRYIQVSNLKYLVEEKVFFHLFNMSGALILEKKLNNNTEVIYFDLDLDEGIYPYKLTIGQNCYTGKIVIN